MQLRTATTSPWSRGNNISLSEGTEGTGQEVSNNKEYFIFTLCINYDLLRIIINLYLYIKISGDYFTEEQLLDQWNNMEYESPQN